MKLDKKQLPQYLALGVLTASVGGYTVYHFAAAGPVSADTRPAAAATASRAAATAPAQAAKPAPAGTAAPAAAVADTGDAPPPTPAMHDPFAVGYVDPGTLPVPPETVTPKLPPLGKQVASLGSISPLPVGLPAAPPLPGSGLGTFSAKVPSLPGGLSVPASPAAPALPDPPKWTVTGVLMGAGGKVAVLRSGETRRIVRAGDFVDSVYRVSAVSRTAVQLRHGTLVYRIVLGGAEPMPGTSFPAPVSAPASAPPQIQRPAVMGSAIIPVYHAAKPHLPLAHLTRQGPSLTLTAAATAVPHAVRKQPAAAKVARAISLGLRLLDGSVLAPRKE